LKNKIKNFTEKEKLLIILENKQKIKKCKQKFLNFDSNNVLINENHNKLSLLTLSFQTEIFI